GRSTQSIYHQLMMCFQQRSSHYLLLYHLLLSQDDADDEDEEESSDSEEEKEEHLTPTVSALALHSSISAFEDSNQTEPFEEGETAATPPPSTYRVTARISVRPYIPMPFPSESEKKARFTTPTGGYEVGESSVAAAAARQIRHALTVDDSRRAEDRLIGRLRRKRRYFRTLSTTYAQEGQQIDDGDRLTRHIQHEYAQRDAAPDDGD
nr:hypothetical protein [Tanacetum cinerariifolium]